MDWYLGAVILLLAFIALLLWIISGTLQSILGFMQLWAADTAKPRPQNVAP